MADPSAITGGLGTNQSPFHWQHPTLTSTLTSMEFNGSSAPGSNFSPVGFWTDLAARFGIWPRSFTKVSPRLIAHILGDSTTADPIAAANSAGRGLRLRLLLRLIVLVQLKDLLLFDIISFKSGTTGSRTNQRVDSQRVDSQRRRMPPQQWVSQSSSPIII